MTPTFERREQSVYSEIYFGAGVRILRQDPAGLRTTIEAEGSARADVPHMSGLSSNGIE